MKPLVYKNVKPNLYLIDEYGNIYSNYKKGFMSPTKDKDGYLKIKLSNGSKNDQTHVRIATLVAYNYIGEPDSYLTDPTVNHIDGNILNNHYSNLEWVERGYNSSIRANKGAGSLNHEAKLTSDQVYEICKLLIETNLSYTEIGNLYGVTKSTISSIKQQKSWKSITTAFDFNCRQNIRENGRFNQINLNLLKGEK